MPVEKSCSELHTRHSRAGGSGIRLAARRASPRTNRRFRRLCFERQCFWLASKLSAARHAVRREPWATTVTAAAAAVPSWLGFLDCTHRVDSRSWATLSRCASCCCLVSCCFSGLVSSSTCVWWSARLLRLPSGGTEPLQQSAIHGVQILFKNVFLRTSLKWSKLCNFIALEMIKEHLEEQNFLLHCKGRAWWVSRVGNCPPSFR